MLLYLAIFAAVLLVNLSNYGRLNRVSFYFMFILLGIFVGIGDMLGGYDRYIYGELFDEAALFRRIGETEKDLQLDVLFSSEPGYVWLNKILTYVTANRYIFIFAVTLIIYILFAKSIYEYCEKNVLGTIIFLGVMFFFTFTYLRQMLACGVAWLSIKYIIDRKIWKFLLVIALAMTFHNGVALMLPCYFLPAKKIKPQTVVVIMLFCLILGAFSPIGLLYQAYDTMSANDVRVGHLNAEGYGFRWEYILEAIVFLSFILPMYKYIPNNRKSLILLNLSLAFCAVLLIFIKSENGGRLAWVFFIGLISTLSTISANINKASSYTAGVIILNFLLYLRIVLAWGIFLYPYKTFFTDGHREGDIIYNKFEYDKRYDENKFYKW